MTVAVDVKRLNEISARVEAARLEAEFGLTNRARALLAGCGETEPQRPWFVLKVADGRENDVENLLRAAGVECWIPSLEVKPKWHGGRRGRRPDMVKVPVWPGYIFAKVVRTDRAWAALARVEGIEGALPTAERPAPIAEDIVLKLKLKLERDEGARAVLEQRLKVGQMVRVDDGPLATFNGVVRALCGHDRLKVDVAMFGRVVTVDLGLDQVSD
jgi:transcription antitermination factor NusG